MDGYALLQANIENRKRVKRENPDASDDELRRLFVVELKKLHNIGKPREIEEEQAQSGGGKNA